MLAICCPVYFRLKIVDLLAELIDSIYKKRYESIVLKRFVFIVVVPFRANDVINCKLLNGLFDLICDEAQTPLVHISSLICARGGQAQHF